MALVVETGAIVTGANTYVSLADFKAWADARGITYGTDEVVTQQIYRAMDYIESLDFKGLKHTETQPLQWPRDMVYIDGYSVDSDEIPNQLKLAVYEAIKVEIDGDSRLSPDEREVISEKIDSISVTYKSSTGMKRATPALTKALQKLTEPMSLVSRA